MSTKQTLDRHPDEIFVLSSPLHRGKANVWYFTKLRPALWGVLDGVSNGRQSYQTSEQDRRTFGRLTWMSDGPAVELTELVKDAFAEELEAMASAGLEMHSQWLLPRVSWLSDLEAKEYQKIRKRHMAKLESTVHAYLAAQTM